MTTPALNIPIRATGLDEFKRQMTATSQIAGTATRLIARNVIAMNAGFLASKGAAGAATIAFGNLLGVLSPILLGITAVRDAFKLVGYSIDLAKAKIGEFNEIATKANAAGVSTDFYQRFTKAAPTAVMSIDQVTEALQRFREASADKLGGSDIQQRIAELTGAGNFQGNAGVAAFAGSTTTEDKIRAIINLIDQAMQKGQRLAALDIAGTAFGDKVRTALADDSGYLDRMLKTADTMSKTKLISDEDIGRAIELKDRMDAAQQTLANKWRPVQDDLAQLGMNYHESWVSITEDLAAAVGYATQLYTALKQVPDWFANRIGNASIWQSIIDATTTPEGRAAAETSLGISSNPKEIGMVSATDKLRAALQNHANVTRGMGEATAVQSAVRGDSSKAPNDKASETADGIDRAINSLNKHIQQQEADTRAVGLGAAALAQFKAEAEETAAVQANGGKETAAQAAQFKELQQRAGNAAEALAKAEVSSEISRSRQTAFLTPEDVAIAGQLQKIYGDDIPKALGSSEAAAIRLNNGLKAVGDAFSASITNPLLQLETGTRTASVALRQFGLSFSNMLLKMVNETLIVKPLLSGIGGIFGVGGGSGSIPVMSGPDLGAGTGGLSFPMFAGGTDSAPGGLAIVGERGPELVNLPQGSQVIPNHVSRQLVKNIPGFADGGVIGGGKPAPLFGSPSSGAVHLTMGDINIHPGTTNGSPAQNRDLAEQIGAHVQAAARAMVGREIRNQTRPGGMLFGPRR